MNKLSPQKYIITKGRNLPFNECYINNNWEETGMATIAISKNMPSGKIIIGTYMVDVFCLGLKDTFYKFNMDSFEYNEFIEKLNNHPDGLKMCDVSLAHNIIYGAIDYADEIGFAPHKDFTVSEYLLDPELITDGIDEIEFGKDGKPFYVSGPNDNVQRIKRILEKNVGIGNYDYLAESEQFDDW
ncbi:MAG: hypothetical protein H8E98_05385 [Bacteroidetes bacterium]|nr:hypothetical protein [Bacteroidota bacterium]